eukprot:CAMPEP_0204238212 /NCGR_PEP_ID=MMETSP0361-20130328/93754_1 /ASSEMBLY_ACC=CAM_ASM_000343 /TAXON_ID=268821 /ORGANISM="Scrippsiella Hangoei, Strain SHTV-5" /LENGTH=271 /DNA_ID=CAMNT_0051210981 /DNA_START=51 /DNA_END=863 /DNA_ORIENTATION=+
MSLISDPGGGAGDQRRSRSTDGSAGLRPRVRAVDCEMVGFGPKGKKSVLARISVVGRRGRVLLDCLVRPDVEVTDWRTAITGLDASCFEEASAAGDAAPKVAPSAAGLPGLVLDAADAVRRANTLLDAAVVVGHDLRHDFKLLRRFHHRRVLLRDTAFCPLLNAGLEGRAGRAGPPSLRALSREWLDESIHGAHAHNSVQDARTAMLLYRIIAPEWEQYVRKKWSEVPAEFLERRSAQQGRKRSKPSESAAGAAKGLRERRRALWGALRGR